ncbi:MAG: hypothetical protein R6V46_16575 [Desulfatiglandaceae bacterium]
MAAFAGKLQQIFVAALPTLDPCKAIMENATVQVLVDNLLYVGPQKPVLFGKAIIIDLLKFLKMVLNTLIIL